MQEPLFKPVQEDEISLFSCSQQQMEELYSKYQTHLCIKNEFIENDFDNMLEGLDIPVPFGLNLLVQMVLHKRATVATLVGILKHHFEDTKAKSAAQQCADMLLHCIDNDIVDYHEIGGQVVIIHDIDPTVQRRIDEFVYPLPMIEEPQPVQDNRDSGYHTIKRSMLLKNNHHEDDICLDHINRMNAIPLRINQDVVAYMENRWKNHKMRKPGETLENYERRKAAFEKYDTVSRDVINAMVNQGNHFWMTHRYDKRGRTYAQGYHVNYQGNDWNKACVEFAEGETLNG